MCIRDSRRVSLADQRVKQPSLSRYYLVPSNPAEYRVIVSGGVFADEGCVLGKIFVDCNVNHVQDLSLIHI